MHLELSVPETVSGDQEVVMRAILVNDGYEAVAISRNAFVGPNIRPVQPPGHPFPESVESTYGDADEPLTLGPFTFYGRERSYAPLPSGELEVSAYYRLPGEPPLTASRRLIVRST